MPRRTLRRISSLSSPIEASELIGCLRADLSDEAHYLISRLSVDRLTIFEIIDELIEQGYRDGTVNESELIKQLHSTRYKKLRYRKMKKRGKVFGFWHGEWYVIRSVADPNVIPVISYGCTKFDGNYAQFHSAVEDILQHSGPLTLGQIIDAVIDHPAYTGPKGPRKVIRVGIDNTLRHNDWKFEKKLNRRGKIPRRYARWGLVGKIEPPKKRVPQKDLLYVAMRAQQVIRGWSLDELKDLVRSPELGFGYCQRADDRCVKAFLVNKLRAKGEERYQRIKLKGKRVRYRALPMVQQKTPSTDDDWDSLVGSLCHDLMINFHEKIEEAAKIHAPLFGWDTSMLPSALLINQVDLALSRLNRS